MSTETISSDENEDDVRILDSRGILAHYAHLRSQPGRKDKRCGFCSYGVGAVVKVVEIEEPKPELVEGDRADEEKDAASSPDRGWNRDRS